MFSQTTFQDILDQLGWMYSDNEEEMRRDLNMARERIIKSGSWNGCVVEVAFNGSTGYITLPAHIASITAVTTDRIPAIVFSRDLPYVEFGPGTLRSTVPGCGMLVDAGDEWVTSVNHTSGQKLRFVLSNAADVDKEIRFFGTVSGQAIFDPATGAEGLPLTLSSTTTDTASTLDTFTGFQKPVTKGTVSVYSWDGTTATLLQVYQPYETRPRYKRYLTGTYDTSKAIGALGRLRYNPIVNPTDFVIPDDINALQYGMKAIQSQNSSNAQEANQMWDQCFQLLNEAHRNSRGKQIPSIVISGPGGYPSYLQHIR